MFPFNDDIDYNFIFHNIVRMQLSLCNLISEDGENSFCSKSSNFCAQNLILNFLMDGGSGKMKEEFSQSYIQNAKGESSK